MTPASSEPSTLADLLRWLRAQALLRRPYRHTLRSISRALKLDSTDHAALLARGAAPRDRPAGARLESRRPQSPRNVVINAPITTIPLIGREADIAVVSRLLVASEPAARLVTLLGPGGVGKTRLALAVASTVTDRFPDGVFFVDLAPLQDFGLIPATICSTVHIPDASGTTASAVLFEHLRNACALLVLDNFEHLVRGAQFLAQLQRECPRLVLLSTSRTALRVPGERRFAVDPLAQPVGEQPSFADIAASPAVRLFVERAQLVAPEFALEAHTAGTVAAVCRRLGGMPLAIELAAARVGLLGPELLLQRLDQQLQLLTSGPPDLPERQRTLSNAVAWSYDLLGPREQMLLRRVSVFAGGWTLRAAETVCADEALPANDVFEPLSGLVDNYLIRRPDINESEPRFRMLESVHEYAIQKLRESGEYDMLRVRHSEWCLALAERAVVELTGPSQATWLDSLDRELDDLRLGLAWLYERQDIERGLRLVGALGRFWSNRRHVAEGREWVERFLMAPSADAAPAAVQARACYAAGVLASIQVDTAQAVLRLEQSIELHHQAGDLVGAVRALNTRGGVSYDVGHLAFAAALWEQTLAQALAAGDLGEASHALGNLGEAHFHMGDVEGAAKRHTEARAMARQVGRTDVEAMQLGNLGNVARARGELSLARTLQSQALVLKRDLGARRQVAITLADFASIAGLAGRGARAARLVGAALALRERIGTPQPVPERVDMESCISAVRASMGTEAWSGELLVGRELSMEQAIEYALE
jgi:non-specific serine/threonine protein kinase